MARGVPPGVDGGQALVALRTRLMTAGNDQRVTYIVGAAMARRIERARGLAALTKTIQGGPAAFLAAYRATLPAAEFSL